MSGMVAFETQEVVVVPVHDLPPMPLGLIWRSAAEDARIRALAKAAGSEGPWPVTADRPATGGELLP
jgi:hypothetical protein